MRLFSLDLLRSLAILWMIIFHTAYDLNLLGLIPIHFHSGFWYAFPRVIAFTFLYCVGVSLKISHGQGINWKQVYKRTAKLALSATSVSVATYFIFPQQWIFFGTLHCILVSSLFGLFFLHRPFLSWSTMILILIAQYLFHYDIKWVSSFLSIRSMDFIPVYPWFWTVLLGINTAFLLKLLEQKIPDRKKSSWISFLGKHSLKIYLLHQPLIYGLLWLGHYLKKLNF